MITEKTQKSLCNFFPLGVFRGYFPDGKKVTCVPKPPYQCLGNLIGSYREDWKRQHRTTMNFRPAFFVARDA